MGLDKFLLEILKVLINVISSKQFYLHDKISKFH